MSKKPKLGDIPGIGPKMLEKLQEVGIKTPLKLSRADPAKLAAKVAGLSEKKAAELIEAAKKLLPPETEKPKKEEKPKKKAPAKKEEAPKERPKKKAAPPKEEKPKKKAPPKKEAVPPVKAPKKKKKPKKKAPAKKPKKVTKKEEPLSKDTLVEPRLLRIANKMRKRQPKFRHEQAHRWIRVKDSWRKPRGIDSATREKRKGRIAMVSTGYRKPRKARGIHPSGYIEVLVHRTEDLEGLNPDLHAVRIAATVGQRKRQAIISQADILLLRVLNPGVTETYEEEELFADLEGIDDLEVD